MTESMKGTDIKTLVVNGGTTPDSKVRVGVCSGAGCRALGSEAVLASLAAEVEQRGVTETVKVFGTGCPGSCQQGPVVIVGPQNYFYQKVSAADAADILDAAAKAEPVERLLYRQPVSGELSPTVPEVPFFKYQERVVLEHSGLIDPDRIEDYIAVGGLQALVKAITSMSPEEVIEAVDDSGLRGRGGAGHTAGAKWRRCREATGDPKYLICNRSALDGLPFQIIEGLIIGAFAVGASSGLVYLRRQNHRAVAQVRGAIDKAYEFGLLGQGIIDSDFSFDLDIYESDSAFIAGEETAMIAAIEGERAVPSVRPPYPVEVGLWGQPTLINNAETFANIPAIISKGADWYRGIGSPASPGTKVFALTGNVRTGGQVELPLGTTIERLVYEIGAGIPGDRKFKALHIGGPSGGSVPASALDMPLDYDSIEAAGAIMGTGDLAVLDECTCMVETVRSFIELMADESCGKCAPCRIGTKRLFEMMDDIVTGRAELGVLDELESLSKVVQTASLCGLGKTAPNPILTTLTHFRDEYESHIKNDKCPAARCSALVKAPCSHTCPAEVDAPSYIALVAQGRYDEAIAVHRERNPFPSICGRVCHHPCETRCKRGQLDEPIAIALVKRFMSDYAPPIHPEFPRDPENAGRKVAIVGAGPAGLSCGYYLALVGYDVTVLEALPEPGGMMKVGIPDFRLPEEILDKEIGAIVDAGVTIETNKELGRDFTVDSLFEDGYKAVFLGTGAHSGNRMGLDREADIEGVMDGATFLRRANLGEDVRAGRRTVVIGGGNVAIDAARTALRRGAEQVKLLYRRTENEMPAYEWDIREAKEEGIEFEFLVSPIGLENKEGTLSGIECRRMVLGARDAQGRRRPEPVEGSDFVEEADMVIAAIGQSPGLDYLEEDSELRGKWGRLGVSSETLMSERSGVFGGGDAVSGPASVVEAVSHGQRAAVEIEKFLTGKSLIERQLKAAEHRRVELLPEAEFQAAGPIRRHPPEAEPEGRKGDFREVVLALSEKDARDEAARCLRCDLDED